jgi:hypothetical protein
MRKNQILKIGLYGLGILIYASWINVGSAIDHPLERWNRPNTLFFIGATTGLLVLYAYYIARVLHLLCYTRSAITAVFNQRLLGYRWLLFLCMTLGLLTALQLLLVTVVLSQHKGYTIFNTYFRRDFWVFFVPLLLYCVYLYRHPQQALFIFKRMDQLQDRKDRLEDHNALLLQRKLELKQENKRLIGEIEQVRSAISYGEQRQADLIAQRRSLLTANADLRRQERTLQEQMEQLLHRQAELAEEISLLQSGMDSPGLPDSHLLTAWQEQRSMPALRAYIHSLEAAAGSEKSCELPVHRVVLCYRKNRCFFIFGSDGEKQMISDRAGRMLIASDWLVKVSSTHYINMLFCVNQLQKYEAGRDKEGAKMVLLDPAVRASIETVLPAAQLNSMLEVSRRLRERFYSFWEHSNLLNLDENGLFLTFRINALSFNQDKPTNKPYDR